MQPRKGRGFGQLLRHDTGRRRRIGRDLVTVRKALPADWDAARDIVRRLASLGVSLAHPRLSLRGHDGKARVRTRCCGWARDPKICVVVADAVGRDHVICQYCWHENIHKPLTKKGCFLSYAKPPVAPSTTGAEVEGYKPIGGDSQKMAQTDLLPEVTADDLGDLPPFLGLDDLKRLIGKKATTVTGVIVKEPRPSEYGFRADVKFKASKHPYTVTFRSEEGEMSLNLKRAIQAYGRKPEAWLGKKFVFKIGTTKTGRYKGNPFMQIEPAEK